MSERVFVVCLNEACPTAWTDCTYCVGCALDPGPCPECSGTGRVPSGDREEWTERADHDPTRPYGTLALEAGCCPKCDSYNVRITND